MSAPKEISHTTHTKKCLWDWERVLSLSIDIKLGVSYCEKY
jgi:hypothetical protein